MRIAELEAALAPFQAWATECGIMASASSDDDDTVNELYPVKTGDLRRAAMAARQGENK